MKKKRHEPFIFLISFIAMTLIAIGAGYYKKAVAVEQNLIFVSKISGEKDVGNKNISKTTVINIKQQGLPKKIIQPNVQIIKGTIVNNGKENLPLGLVSKGFDGKVILSASDKSLDSSNGKFNNVLKKNEVYDITITLNLLRDKINQHEVSVGIINIVNLKNKNIIGTIPIKVINSSIKGSDNDDTIKCLIQGSCKQK
ncbi:MAG TPA: hypothetical protein VIK86_08455 [Candidatus Paceibacterota bacterium]